MSDRQETVQESVIRACQAMSTLGLSTGTSGNISIRQKNGFFISPSGVPYEKLTPQDVVHLDWNGRYEGPMKPSSEWRFHLQILMSRPDINAVVHTHSVSATTVAILGRDIPAIHYAIAAAGGSSIRCAPYELFGSKELADRVIAALTDRHACLMSHHGVIACGSTVDRALDLAVTVEELAAQYLACLPICEPPLLSDAQMEAVLEKFRTYGQVSLSEEVELRPAA